MAEAEFRRGPAVPGQLPKGQAQDLNQAVAATPPPEAAATPPAVEPAPPGSDLASPPGGPPPPAPPPFVPQTDEEKFLFGTTERPNEPVHAGMVGAQPIPPPPEVMDFLPLLQQAANEPGAPPGLMNFLSLLNYHLQASR